jgi:hypothetical protein
MQRKLYVVPAQTLADAYQSLLITCASLKQAKMRMREIWEYEWFEAKTHRDFKNEQD